MKNLLDGIEEILLMGPGPSCVPPTVYEALANRHWATWIRIS